MGESVEGNEEVTGVLGIDVIWFVLVNCVCDVCGSGCSTNNSEQIVYHTVSFTVSMSCAVVYNVRLLSALVLISNQIN